MKYIKSILTASTVLLASATAFAGPTPPPPIPEIPGDIDEYNAMVLVDVTGSMGEDHAVGTTKMDQALSFAKDRVLALKAKAGNKSLEFALWAYDSSFPSVDGYVTRIYDFPAAADNVLAQLGFAPNGDPQPSTRNAVFSPTASTPLAAAGCYATTTLVASLTDTGGIIEAGYEWNKTIGSRRANIERHLILATDGLENATPTSNECYGVTSTADYANYEADSWQYKLRNKLLTGNPNSVLTANSGLVVDVGLIFQDFVTGLASANSEPLPYSGGMASYTTEPTLGQALTFYKGLAMTSTKGVFKTITVGSDGQVSSRVPGDVDYSGCVGNADYTELVQWYGQQVTPNHPHSYWADLNADGWVDYLDYLILVQNWGIGGVC